MDKVREDIECIREEEKPENTEYTILPSFLLDGEKCEKVWDDRKDEIPYESSERAITRDEDTHDCEKSCIETKGCIGS